jgi:ABC-type bacteriocin/lantibiotic exporter with double-glycine peptidase domain
MPAPRSLVGIVVFAAMLCGVARAAEPPGLWIDVPFVAQTTDGCGAASIAMVMQYWQQQLDKPATDAAQYAQIEHALYAPQAHGIYASAMQRYFAQNGYRAFAFTGDAAALQEHLAKGRPLIAALKPGAGSTLHYVVVVGIDPGRGTLLVNDPAQRKLLTEDSARFEREWAATGHWTLLAVPLTVPEVTAR